MNRIIQQPEPVAKKYGSPRLGIGNPPQTWDWEPSPNMDKGPTMDSYCSYFNILLFDNRTDIADVNEPSKHEWVFDGF